MRQFNTLTGFLLSKSSNPTANDTVEFKGYDAIGDGGNAQWKHNGVTGQTASQSPTDLSDNLLNDASGNQWALITGQTLNFSGTQWYPLPFGDSGNGGYVFDSNGWGFVSLINDLSQAYIFDTVAEYKASAIVFPVGKTVHLNDRDADFTVSAGVVGATGNKIIASASISQKITLNDEQIIRIESFGTTQAAIQEAVNDLGVSATKINSGSLSLRSASTFTLNARLDFDRKNTKVAGNNAIIQWAGPAGVDMIRVTDSSRCKFEDFAIIGLLASPPAAAFHFEALSPAATLGTNENIVIENVIMGRRWGTDTTTGGSADASPAGLLTNGILVDGAVDGNNDEYTIKNTQIHSCTDYGINFANFQGVWSQIENTLANDCGTGMRFGCNMNLINPSFNRNATADLEVFRTVEIRILNIQSENLEKLIKSSQSASVSIIGGRFLRNNAASSNIIEFLSGGNLYLSGGLFFNNSGGGEDQIYWRNGGSLRWTIDIKQSNFLSGKRRSFYDIDSGGFGSIAPVINIDVEGFEITTKQHYLDREFNVASLANGAQISTAMGSSGMLLSDLTNVSYGGDCLATHITPLVTSDANSRFTVTNLSGSTADLPVNRFRVLNVNDKVSNVIIAPVVPGFIADGSGVSLDVTFPSCKVGDMLAWSTSGGWNNVLVTAYVKSDGVATIRIHNASGGGSAPASSNVTIAIMKPIGQISAVISTGITIADGSVTTINVPNLASKLGSHTWCSYSQDLKSLNMTSNANADGNIELSISNKTGASVTLTAGAFTAMTYA